MNTKHFFLTQVNNEGSETGEVKVLSSIQDVIAYLEQDEKADFDKEEVADTLEAMNPGDFDTVVSGDFIYEVDCIDEDTFKQLQSENGETVPKEVDVFDLFDGKEIVKVFGIESLKEKLQGFGIAEDRIAEIVAELEKDGKSDVSFEEDKDNIEIDKLTLREIHRLLKTDEKFALEYKTAQGMAVNESTTTEKEEQGDKSREEQGDSQKKDDAPNQEKIVENYLGYELKMTECEDGKKCCEIFKNGEKIRTTKGYKDGKQAVAVAKSRIDFGKLNESEEDDDKVYEITVSVSRAQDVANALNDDPFIKHNIEWTSSNSFTFEDGGDCELRTAILEQLEAAGIPGDEYSIDTI